MIAMSCHCSVDVDVGDRPAARGAGNAGNDRVAGGRGGCGLRLEQVVRRQQQSKVK